MPNRAATSRKFSSGQRLLELLAKGWMTAKFCDGGGRDGDARNPFRGRRQRGKERERKMADSVAKFGTVRSVPGIDGVERLQLRNAGAFDHSDQIQASIGESAGAIGEADQGQQGARRPHFGVIGARSFERGERKDDVADRAGRIRRRR